MHKPILGPGLCECGCGQATSVAKETNAHYGYVKGRSLRFVVGHSGNNGPAAFWRQIDRSADCWIWTGKVNDFGYGQFGLGAKYVHRAMYEHANGPILDDLCVLHRCDNPPCCNPAHLFLGTRADNATDMARKGRGTRKLTDEQVIEIRQIAEEESMRCTEIARHFGVSHSLVSMIVARKIRLTALTDDCPARALEKTLAEPSTTAGVNQPASSRASRRTA